MKIRVLILSLCANYFTCTTQSNEMFQQYLSLLLECFELLSSYLNYFAIKKKGGGVPNHSDICGCQ